MSRSEEIRRLLAENSKKDVWMKPKDIRKKFGCSRQLVDRIIKQENLRVVERIEKLTDEFVAKLARIAASHSAKPGTKGPTQEQLKRVKGYMKASRNRINSELEAFEKRIL